MKKIRVIQQVMAPQGGGGVNSEYRALQKSDLVKEYDFIPMLLENYHSGLNIKDILYYYKAIKCNKPDIVHIRGAAVDGLNAEIAAKLAGNAKILVFIHGVYSDMVYLNPIKRFLARSIIEPLCFKLADGISCVYKSGNKMSQLAKYQEKVLPHVYNRIPNYSLKNKEATRKQIREQENIPLNSKVCVYCGGVSKEKGFLYFIDSIKSMKPDFPNELFFIIIGDGDLKQEMFNIVQSLGLGSKFLFTGNIENVVPYLCASDFFVMPSLHENHSVALLEAAAMGLPAIATSVGGNTEIVINKETGIIINPYSSEEIKNAIYEMISDDVLYRYTERVSSHDYDIFSDSKVDEALRYVYQRVLNR